jgi:hypothetical protein
MPRNLRQQADARVNAVRSISTIDTRTMQHALRIRRRHRVGFDVIDHAMEGDAEVGNFNLSQDDARPGFDVVGDAHRDQ